jgi:hypothetical protein
LLKYILANPPDGHDAGGDEFVIRSRRRLRLPAISTSGDCAGGSVLLVLRPSSTGYTIGRLVDAFTRKECANYLVQIGDRRHRGAMGYVFAVAVGTRGRCPQAGSLPNRSLVHFEPVSNAPKRKLKNGEQRQPV